ncbi:MAG TPA: class I SAM-dependent methyltransferase [Puia sp.]|nr:class I SAM-dependent methyltransferase [Puia sp.]
MAALTPQEKAEKTYNFAADLFDDPALGFWDRYGRRTVERLGLKPGMRVLDVCCGTGASALPAAEAVGATGSVVGVDLAENLLALARDKAVDKGLQNVEFMKADMTALPFEPNSFDAVIIVFGIFFVPDMEAQVQRLWRLVRPGGRLAITTWGPRLFEPAYTQWKAAVAEVAPEWVSDFNPWDRITTVDAVLELIEDALPDEEAGVVAERGVQELKEPEDFWRIAMGSGLRWPIEQMGEVNALLLKENLLLRLTERPDEPVTSIETNVIYGVVLRE